MPPPIRQAGNPVQAGTAWRFFSARANALTIPPGRYVDSFVREGL